MRPNDFDGIAKWYDQLAKLVFGDSIKRAQLHFLSELPSEGKLLIIGGGTGWILEEVFKVRPNLRIDYVEASEKMIGLSKARNVKNRGIQFVLGTEADIPNDHYDGIITNFFLDVFDEDGLKRIMLHLKGKLSQRGVWICTDFQDSRKWNQRFLLKLMHLFFRMMSNLDAKALKNFENEFDRLSFTRLKKHDFYKGMIFSVVYRII